MECNKGCDNWLANEKSMRRYLSHKYWVETTIVLVSFTAIIVSAWQGYIDKNTTGALLGVAVGYGLKGFRKLHK